MAQTTILAAGTTQAVSTDTVVAAGASSTVGLFVAAGLRLDPSCRATIYIDSPGADSVERDLDYATRQTVIGGACTYRVVREQCGAPFGIYTE